MKQFVTFRLENEKYGVDILKVQEINNLKEFTKVPHAPDYVEGAINLRGKVIPVLNLRKRFGLGLKPLDETTKIVIMNVRGIVTGILVDSVSEVLRIPQNIIVPPPPTSASIAAQFIVGIARLEQELIILLDIDKLLGSEEYAAVFGSLNEMSG